MRPQRFAGDTLGFRARLFLASVALLAVFGIASGWWLHQELRPLLEQRESAAQIRSARLIRTQIVRSAMTADPEALDALADHAGHALASRVTIIHSSGRVLGDSDVDISELGALDDHASRPEVERVLASPEADSAHDRRRSATLGDDLVYTAVPVSGQGWQGAVRVARPTAEIDATITSLRKLLVLAGIVGLFASLGMIAFASWLMTRDLRALLEDTAAIATGDESTASAPLVREYATIAGSVRSIKRDLDGAVSSLAAERNRFEAVLSGMSEAVIALDPDGRLSMVNPAGTRLIGIGQARYGQTLLECIRAPELADVADHALAGRSGSAEFELRRRTPEGLLPRRLIAHATPQDGGGCVVTLLDVTDVRRLETIRRDFVANVSHELRTPVSIISASAEALVDGAMADPEYASHFLQAIERNSLRLGALIEDLLRIARLEEGRQGIDLQPVGLEALITEVTEVLGPRLNDHRHRLVVDIPQNASVLADPGALEQVLVNLLENASKYTPDKGTILVRTAPDPDDPDILRIEIADDGPGIAEHHRARLFERFYRVDPGRARDVGGTGLGLAIVKHLVDAMAGEVGMSPNHPRGSVFWLRLSRSPSTPADDGAAESAPSAG
ncbi:MAG: ATP-binding protein [Myxococcota bacterium]|nr:ATP-binding protein [Myxococcota bacterium]MEC8422274.1 ATP-binding protein [Myxococcota bacterium]